MRVPKKLIMQNAECRMQNAEPTLRSESRGQTCLCYAKPQGGKACAAGLMQNAECKMQNRHCGARAEGKLVCAMPSRKEEKPAKQD